MKKLKELWENSGRECNTLRDEINEQKEYFTIEIEILKKNQIEILQLELTKWEEECIRNKAGHMEGILYMYLWLIRIVAQWTPV